MVAVMKSDPSSYDGGIISHAKTVRGLLRWAYETCSRDGCTTSRFWPRLDGLKRSLTRLDAITEAAWILGCIKTIPAHCQTVVSANYGYDAAQQVALAEMLAKLAPGLHMNLIVCVVRQWCGENLSMRQFRRLTGLTERRVRDGREALREYLLRWDEAAITRLQYQFEQRGWMEV
jgi:hypothetical protein